MSSAQGMELWTTFQSYVADHQSSTPADDSNIEDLAIGEEAPTIESALGLSPMDSNTKNMGKVAAYYAMI